LEKIIFTKKYPSINTREIRLENGVRIFFKPTKNKEKSFYFEASSMGGYSHANLAEMPSAKVTDDVISESSLGDFSRVELDNKLDTSFANVEVVIGPYQEGLNGRAITKYTKELFELIYLNFTSVRFNDVGIENIKSQFPIFSKKINGKPLIYLDSSNSSQKPMCVINRLNDFYKNEFSNIGRSIHSLAVNATNKFEETRMSVKNFINANSKDEIIFTKNATESINLVATTFGQQNIVKGDEILITDLEHHSNYVPWHFLRETRGAIIKFAPINEDGDIIIDELIKLITSKTKIIAVTHLSNVTGTIVPIKEIVEIAH